MWYSCALIHIFIHLLVRKIFFCINIIVLSVKIKIPIIWNLHIRIHIFFFLRFFRFFLFHTLVFRTTSALYQFLLSIWRKIYDFNDIFFQLVFFFRLFVTLIFHIFYFFRMRGIILLLLTVLLCIWRLLTVVRAYYLLRDWLDLIIWFLVINIWVLLGILIINRKLLLLFFNIKFLCFFFILFFKRLSIINLFIFLYFELVARSNSWFF